MKTAILLLTLSGVLSASVTWTGAGASSGTFPTKPTSGQHPATYTVNCSASVGTPSEIQSAYDDAYLGDTIKLEAGCTFTFSGQTVDMKKKTNGTGYLTITTTQDAKLPNSGTRITRAYLPLLPLLQASDNNPIFYFSGRAGFAAGPDHIKLRGVAMRPNPGYAFDAGGSGVYNYGFIKLGDGEGYYESADRTTVGSSNTTQPYGLPYAADAKVSGSFSSGVTSIVVSDTTPFAVSKRWYVYQGACTPYPSCLATTTGGHTHVHTTSAINAGTNTITFTPALVEALNTNTSIYHLALDLPTTAPHLPDDIVIQHCLFLNPEMVDVVRMITADARTLVIRDNFMEGNLNAASLSDSQGIAGSNGRGPYTIENNAIVSGGSENIMFGGSPPSGNWEPDGVTVRFNWLAHTPERDRMFAGWCATQNTCTGDDSGRDFGVNNIIPNSKLVFRGAEVLMSGSGDSARWIRAMNTGFVSAITPDWAGTADGANMARLGGVVWHRWSGTQKNLIKNNYETKSSRNVLLQYNFIDWFSDSYFNNSGQAALVNLKATASAGCSTPWPTCYVPYALNITMRSNKLHVAAAGWLDLVGERDAGWDVSLDTTYFGNYTIDNNFFYKSEPTTYTGPSVLSPISLSAPRCCDATSAGNGRGILSGVKITHNTFYDPFIQRMWFLRIEADSTTPGAGLNNWFPNGEFRGNLFARGTAIFRDSNTTPDTINSYLSFPCFGDTSTCSGKWAKNAIIGADDTSTRFPPGAGTVFTNCASGATCNDGTGAPAWTANGGIFRNTAKGLYTVKNSHAIKRAAHDGLDIGADMSQIPNIGNLQVSPTDRSVLFTWNVTAPIASTPCVIEVHTSPDFDTGATWYDETYSPIVGAYAGELAAANIGTYYRRDADDYDGYTRRGLARMAIIGANVNLTANTRYFYRLQCGGDARRGYFTTLATLSGTASFRLAQKTAASMSYGTAYSRGSDTISGGGAGSCASNVCTATLNRGSVYFYRVGSGPVRVAAIP